MELKPGYKQTEVGVIPEDWEVEPLESFTSFISYGFTNPMPAVSNGIYMVTAKDINEGRIILESARQTSKVAYEQLLSSKSKPKNNDVLLTKDGTLGRLALVGNEKICINQSVALLRPSNRISPAFFKFLLESPFYQHKMLGDAGGSTIKHIYITIVNRMSIAIPSKKEEQTAIANALSDADALIQSLTRLIAKKRQIKQGAMQTLLNPYENGRLKAGWVVKKLGNVADIRSGGTPSTRIAEFWNGEILWCTPTDITALRGKKYLYSTSRKITSKGLAVSSAEIIPENSIVMTSRATIGECAINKLPVSTNQGFKNFMPYKDVDIEFLYYQLLTQKRAFIGLCSGSTFLEISKNQLFNFEIPLPRDVSEQTRIATILSDMDDEIAALETKLAKYRQIKQGMMQNLLTGRVRLI